MSGNPRLSKGILEMKFMKRTKDKLLVEEDTAASRAMYSNEITDKMLCEQSQLFMEPSYVPCENLREGRFSFRGMNPEIERLLELEDLAKQNEKLIKSEKDISDQQLAKIFEMNKKRQNQSKFIFNNKPADNTRINKDNYKNHNHKYSANNKNQRTKLNLPRPAIINRITFESNE